MKTTTIPANLRWALALFLLVPASLQAQIVSATFNAVTDVPITASSYTATGQTISFTLNYAPLPGTILTVINNRGSAAIDGTFDNLGQGAAAALSYGGTTYNFVANYHGGPSGNHLTLQWTNSRPAAWGSNVSGQLGFTGAQSNVPVVVNTSGVLAGKTVIGTAAGRSHNLALCSDGFVCAWGDNSFGQLGNSGTIGSSARVAVDTSGTLSGKTVVAVAAGAYHSLALCSDGTLVAWGQNLNGQLGKSGTSNSPVPIGVNTAGALAGKTVVAIAAGAYHNLALCSDGSVCAWGHNIFGQLGNGTTASSTVPVTVIASGALAGKTVIAVAAGAYHSLALCSDGSVYAWGANWYGNLGNNSRIDRWEPVAVDQSAGLAGKSVTALAAGGNHNLALCSDGSVVAWGNNGEGALGITGSSPRTIPVTVTPSGSLVGKTVLRIAAGADHSLAFCSDGTTVAWGYNITGALGNNTTTTSSTPVTVNLSGMPASVKLAAVFSGPYSLHSLGLVGSPIAEPIMTGSATASGTYNSPFSYNITASGSPTSFGASGLPSGLSVNTTTGLISGNPTQTGTFSATVIATNSAGSVTAPLTVTIYKAIATVTLTNLSVTYDGLPKPVTVTTNPANRPVVVTYDGGYVVPGNPGSYSAVATVNDPNYQGSGSGTLVISPAPTTLNANFTSASTVPLTTSIYYPSGATVNLSLNFAPATGSSLTIVKITGMNMIRGTFQNLAQGQSVSLAYGGTTYHFVANYFGGSGRDLVLQWADLRLVGWGYNYNGQLGNGGNATALVPASTNVSGVLAGKTVIAASAADDYSLFLCADGSVASSGGNSSGQLGTSSTTSSLVPVATDTSGCLAGKTIASVAAGSSFALALCSDSTVVGWGYNGSGQLGTGTTDDSLQPIVTATSGALTGKVVVAVSAGDSHALAACSDGSAVAWGYNVYGQLGNGSTNSSSIPVAVTTSGVLAGKTVVAVSAGSYHSLILCSDGTVFACGVNWYGQLGNNSTTASNVPVAVTTSGALSGKTVIAISAGAYHSMALCSDGTLVTWGANWYGQLGNNTTTQNLVPVAVNSFGVLPGKTVKSIGVGAYHCVAICSDGTAATWGYNSNGQLGNNSTTNSLIPVAVNNSGLSPGEIFSRAFSTSQAMHNIGIIAMPAGP